jgi:hypothetical protein
MNKYAGKKKLEELTSLIKVEEAVQIFFPLLPSSW